MKRLFQLAILIGLSTAGFLFLKSEWTRVQEIEITQSANSSPILFERIKNSLEPQLKQKEGQRVWKVSLKELQKLVAKDRRVKNISIHREFPSKVNIVIEPYSPLLAYLDSDGKVYPVAKDATLLPAVSAQERFDIPILRGSDMRDNMGLRELAIKLLESIPTNGAFSQNKISEIVYTKEDGFKIFLARTSTEVKFGDTDFGLKVSRVGKVLSYLDNQNIKSRVIDARFSKKVVVRPRNAP